jgi:hypothetical protein
MRKKKILKPGTLVMWGNALYVVRGGCDECAPENECDFYKVTQLATGTTELVAPRYLITQEEGAAP